MNIKNILVIFVGVINVVLVAFVVYYFTTGELYIGKKPQLFAIETSQHITNIAVPYQQTFCNEEVPLENQFCRESLDRELQINSYWHSSTLSLLKNGHKWFPVIEPILRKNNIPDDFKYLALIESGLQNVVSPRGAAGFWQLMKGTGRDYGLEINKDVDERYHVEKATEVACRYLRKAKDKLGTWTLAAASYNAGQRRISNALKKQKVNSYYDLYLNAETARYIYRILAIKQIYSKPEYYGFFIERSELYPPLTFETFSIDYAVNDLVAFAKKHGMDYKTFKTFNPWSRNTKLRNSKHKVYTFKKPDNRYRKLISN